MVRFEAALLAFRLGYVTASSVTQLASTAAQIPLVTAAPEPRAVSHPALNKRTSELITGSMRTRPDLIGYITANSSTYATYCNPGYTWSSIADFATCCAPNSACAQVTACVDETQLLDTDGERWNCLDDGVCVVQTVFDDYPSQSPHSLILCRATTEDYATILYRHFSTTESSSNNGPSSTQATASAKQTTDSNSTTDKEEHKSSNIGVIVGAVVGAVIVIAAVIGLLVWILKKRKGSKVTGKVQQVTDEPARRSMQTNSWEEKQVQTGSYEWRHEADSSLPVARPYEVLGSTAPAQQWHEMEGSHASYEMTAVPPARR